jgi:hypothetical protein
MDWDLAIKRNSEALKGIIEALFLMLGLADDGTVSPISQPLYRAVLCILRPAESAMRRLIVIAARGLVVKVAPSRPMLKGLRIGKGGVSKPSFQLIDKRKRFPELSERRIKYSKHPPRILFLGPDSKIDDLWPGPSPKVASPSDGLVNAIRITRRLQALKLALDDLPRQAKRLARWRLRREVSKTPTFTSPMRPGRPPGSRRRHIHEIDKILDDLHSLAWEALKPNTS